MDLDFFISKYVVKRDRSMFAEDIQRYHDMLLNKISGKSVLVIGGAGSIGSSFIKAILEFKPLEVVVVDINENALAELVRDIRSTSGMSIPKIFITYPMDFSSLVFEKMLRRHGKFDVVANFSAHKHVRSEKDIYSIEALLSNNVLKVKKLLDLLVEFPPEEYFCVSTDKAANPVNIMGASKRIMEDLIFSYSDMYPVKTARFANVAFSNGSLPAGFLSRMAKLQPISAPLDVKRFFVSPKESGQICMLACILGNNREVFFPKLESEQMMRFDEIATALLHENGYEVLQCDTDEEAIDKAKALKHGSKQYPVHFSRSDTTGEKPFEEFYTNREAVDMARYGALGVIVGKGIPNRNSVNILFDKLESAFQNEVDKVKIVDIIADYLPEFKHVEVGKSLDEKM